MAEDEGPLGTVGLAATTLYVTDLDRSVAWYASALGLQPAMVGRDGDRYASFVIGGAIVVLEPRGAALEATGAPGDTTINLVVEGDAGSVRAELVARGASCGELVTSPNYASFLVRDPDGNRFYVAQPRTAQAGRDVADALGGSPT